MLTCGLYLSPGYRNSPGPGVFISYAREDLQAAQKLEKILQAEGLRVWRDQESIYAGSNGQKPSEYRYGNVYQVSGGNLHIASPVTGAAIPQPKKG